MRTQGPCRPGWGGGVGGMCFRPRESKTKWISCPFRTSDKQSEWHEPWAGIENVTFTVFKLQILHVSKNRGAKKYVTEGNPLVGSVDRGGKAQSATPSRLTAVFQESDFCPHGHTLCYCGLWLGMGSCLVPSTEPTRNCRVRVWNKTPAFLVWGFSTYGKMWLPEGWLQTPQRENILPGEHFDNSTVNKYKSRTQFWLNGNCLEKHISVRRSFSRAPCPLPLPDELQRRWIRRERSPFLMLVVLFGERLRTRLSEHASDLLKQGWKYCTKPY